MSQETIIPAQPGYFVLTSAGAVAPVIAWSIAARRTGAAPIVADADVEQDGDLYVIWSDAVKGLMHGPDQTTAPWAPDGYSKDDFESWHESWIAARMNYLESLTA